MISIGNHSGKGLPNYYIHRRTLDYILETVTLLLVLGTWLICFMQILPEGKDAERFSYYLPMLIISLIGLFTLLLPNRVPTKYYNFPVPVHKDNIINQLFLAHRAFRSIGGIMSLMAFLQALSSVYSFVVESVIILLLIVLIVLVITVYISKAYKYS